MAHIVAYVPTRADFIERGHDGIIVTPVECGGPRMRKDKSASNPVVSLAWAGNRTMFGSLMLSWELHEDEDWDIAMLSLYGYDNYLCRLIPGTFQWQVGVGNMEYVVKCEVEVIGRA